MTHQDLSGTWFGDTVDFRWVQTFNGCDYLAVDLVFRDGVFSNLIDHRQLYSIDNTSVNISKEQAIKIALEAVKNYSYRMSDDWVVTGFNVIEDQATANLQPQMKESNVLYPAWSVTLPLAGVYPGSVTELLVGIWADTGEVYLVHHQAYGGAGYLPESTPNSDQPTTPSSASSESNGASIDLSMVAVIAIAVIAVVITTLLVKKRSK